MNARAARLAATGALFLGGAAITGPAAAAPPASRVVLLHAADSDTLSRQGTTLLKAELQAVGFEMVEVDRVHGHDLRRDIESASARFQPVATFAIDSVPGGTTVELWLEDRVTGKLVIRRVEVSAGPRAAADLAVKAVELLRGSLLEVTVQAAAASEGAPATPLDVRRFVDEGAVGRRSYFAQGWGLSAGAAALRNLGLPFTYAPSLRISWGDPRGTVFRLTATGLGWGPRLRAPEGEARVHQALLLAGVARLFRPRARLQPWVGLAAGAHQVGSTGMGTSPLFPDQGGTTTAVALGADGGIALRPGERLALLLELSLLGSVPRTAIMIATREVARTGGVIAVFSASLCAAF